MKSLSKHLKATLMASGSLVCLVATVAAGVKWQ